MEVVVEHSFIHPRWTQDEQRSAFNLALLKLPKVTKQPIPKMLVDHFSLNTGQMLSAGGWGASSTGPVLGGEIFSSQSLEPQEFVDSRRCNATMWKSEMEDGLFCGLNAQRTASCIVDSGSPMLLMDMPKYELHNGNPELDFLVGLNVDGAPCGTFGKPDVYVDLRDHQDWIADHIHGDAQPRNEL
eukprot:evm.model.scf_2812.1 EVM.evm.TU.scf_2812.1   scf_2812:3613-8003(+)